MGFALNVGESWNLRLNSGSTLSTIKGYNNSKLEKMHKNN
jgi:hypothetical protein